MNVLDSRFYTWLIVETSDRKKKITEVTLDDVTPVSYTHLDVYKRQVPMTPNLSINTPFPTSNPSFIIT